MPCHINHQDHAENPVVLTLLKIERGIVMNTVQNTDGIRMRSGGLQMSGATITGGRRPARIISRSIPYAENVPVKAE